MARRILNRAEAHRFARSVRLVINQMGITHEVLALACAEEGVSVPYVKQVLNGAVVYESAKLRAIAAALGLNLPAVHSSTD